ncbi:MULTISPECIES: spondin domain-containing protein [unclassified Corallococcus]|uniref:spondin domain-containing protein n=1 Tax=unclassified Corallococcus TaxID=2685029 RepID=UPI001A8FCC83|nr:MULTISPECIES: spondin domain-containing protein [unclassified Corallococcus]MBN9687918.1 spondin domain-containing protein [Corallococcus sp. NCSPR001]WAS88269.1 spondin domain-containing protein [Corallococcus sp. NCRR]
MSIRSFRVGAARAALGLLTLSACGSGDDTDPSSRRFRVRIENVAPFQNLKSGRFDTKVSGTSPGPLAPGDTYEFSFTAGVNHRLSFAAMFGASNDWFFGTEPQGIPLYSALGQPLTGDITSQILLWDAGTEVNEEPGVGAHTGPKQATSTDGPGINDFNSSNVRRVGTQPVLSSGLPFNLPPLASMIRVQLAHEAATNRFTVRIENVSDDRNTLSTSEGIKPVRISPGVWVVSAGNEPLFTEGQPDRGQGLETLAEGGDATALDTWLKPLNGVATPLSPGVFAVHTAASPLFTEGAQDRGQGLEALAETGDASRLANALTSTPPAGVSKSGTFNTPVDASAPGPLLPGRAYEFTVNASPGDRLSFATMFGQSNDWFFGPDEQGIALFDKANAPVTGDITSRVYLWDAGTELDEEPAVGPHQGAPEWTVDTDQTVRRVPPSRYGTPLTQHLRVTLTAE